MSTEVAEETVAYKMDEATTQTEEQSMPEEPSLAEDGDVADNDESTLGSEEQERRKRRRSRRKTKKRMEEDSDDDDDDTYFSTSNDTKKKEDGIVTKAIDRFVDLLNPVEKDMDDDTLVSEATNGTTPTLTKESTPKPSLMQQLDKHVLTRFGCSSNPAYIPEDEAVDHPMENEEPATDARSTEEASAHGGGSVPAGDSSAYTYGMNSILHVDEDPGDPDVQLQALDEENSSEEEADDGPRAFFCGAVPLKGEKGASNVMSEIAEEKKTDDEQAKGIMYSPSQLEDMPFDQQPPKPAEPEPEPEPEAPTEKGVFGSFTENFSPMLANITSKVFPQDANAESPSNAGDDLQKGDVPASETAEPTLVEGETIFEEAAMEGHEVPTKDNDEPSEEGEEVPGIPEEFERKESEMPFDQASDEAKSEEEDEEEDEDEEDNKDVELEAENTPEEGSPEEESPKEEEPEEELKEEIEVPAPVSFPSEEAAEPAAKSKKGKKKKKSIIGRMFKRKSKKDKAPKESILEYDEQKDFSPSLQLIIPEDPEEKATRPAVPVDPTVTNKSKRESWKNARNSKQELDASIPKTDSADFDLLLTKTSSSKNTANDDWDKLTSPATPTKSRPEGSSSSPSGVDEFPDGRVEL